jgi:hypothetical protein
MEYARAGKLEEWVHAFLLSDGNNKPFSDGLKLYERAFYGPVKMPLSLFTRGGGPEEGMRWRMDPVSWEQRVGNLVRVMRTEKDMPPLIARYAAGGFELNDGNHRFEALTRLGEQEHHFIVWVAQPEDSEAFIAKFGTYLQAAPPQPGRDTP